MDLNLGFLKDHYNNFIESNTAIYTFIFLVLYTIYYLKYSIYYYEQNHRYHKGSRIIGKTLPSSLNGWFKICNSSELPKKKTIFYDKNNAFLVVFRGEDNKVYALDAYCSHMGANLSDGNVTQKNCISCPFHNWTFSGETGVCMSGKNQKKATKFKYKISKCKEGYTKYNFIQVKNEEITKCNEKKEKQGFNLEKKRNKIKINETNSEEEINLYSINNESCNSGEKCLDDDGITNPNLKNYVIFENAGIIYVYIHAIREKELNPDYYPFDFTEYTKKLEYRGIATNKTTNQFQDMPENGADIAHFTYIHPQVIPYFVHAYWKAKWIRGNSPTLLENVGHKDCKWIDEYRQGMCRKFINEKNKDKIGIVLLDNYMNLFGITNNLYLFTLIGFQLGPGLVYLFLKSKYFGEVAFIQHTDLKNQFDLDIHHEIYCSYWTPYWYSALKLRLEALQVNYDCKMWDRKKFGSSPWFNLSTEADNYLVEFRKFYCQFYDGCKEKDERLKETKYIHNW